MCQSKPLGGTPRHASALSFAVSINPVRDAWFEAALDLRIRIQEPNPLEGVPDDYARIVHIPDFGGGRGTVVFAQDFEAAVLERFDTATLRRAGYFCSIVSSVGHSRYDREAFIEALLDWGYYGPADRCPKWYAERKNSEQGRCRQRRESALVACPTPRARRA
jgi:hypothetical protein